MKHGISYWWFAISLMMLINILLMHVGIRQDWGGRIFTAFVAAGFSFGLADGLFRE